MKSQAKLILALALLFAVIFGVTVISSYTSPTVKNKPITKEGEDPLVDTPPLAGSVTEYRFDANADDSAYHQKLFSGFFEVGTGGVDNSRHNWVPFVLRNFRPHSVKMSPLPPSCTACTSARAVVLPDGAIDDFARMSAVGDLFGMSGIPNPLAAIAWANATDKLNWFTFNLYDTQNIFTVPAAASIREPKWVIVELDFRVTQAGPPMPKTAKFDLYDSNNVKLLAAPMPLVVTYAPREAFELWPITPVTIGEFPEGIHPRTQDIYVYSMTRDAFPPPSAVVPANDGTFTLGTPIPMTPAECLTLAGRVSQDLKGSIRIRSGYRIPVTVARQAATGTPPEVGEFEKDIHVANATVSPVVYKVTFKGSVTGAVRIDGAAKLDLGTYKGDYRLKKTFSLVSDRADLNLELVPERCEPKFVQLTLAAPQTESGRRSWELTAIIPEQQGRKGPLNGTVVLRTTGPNPVTFRFPVTGQGQ